MKSKLLIVALALLALKTNAQKTEQSIALAAQIGSPVNASLAYNYNWHLGKKSKFIIGTGARFTAAFGKNVMAITAPAELTTGKCDPSVLFSDQKFENIDSITMGNVQANSLNILINVGYKINSKFSAVFSIDAAGFSFGASQKVNYVEKNTNTTAQPSPFNLLLISDNDLGSLNSMLNVKYALNNKFDVFAGAGFNFTEYKTSSQIQFSNNIFNDRFRNKSFGLSIGGAYKFNN